MFKIIIAFCFCIASANCFAQIQRITTSTYSSIMLKDSSKARYENIQVKSKNEKQILKSLNLNKEQRDKLKAIKQKAKSQKEVLINDDTITDKERKGKLKVIRQEADEAIKNILTEEQWKKFVEEREAKKPE